MLCKDFSGHTMILDLVLENQRIQNCCAFFLQEFLDHIMILDVVSKACRESKLQCSARTFWPPNDVGFRPRNLSGYKIVMLCEDFLDH